MIAEIVNTYSKRFNVRQPYFNQPPAVNTALIVCIPSFKEPDILTTLRSLARCMPPSGTVILIIVVNAPENSAPEILSINSETVSQINQWIENEQPGFINTLIIREEGIAKKDAGAGIARKIGMDEAVQQWAMIERDGPIICLDADCTVSADYLIEAEKIFSNSHIRVAHFQFEHVYDQEQDPVLREGIIQYELHLRCYIEGLRLAGYPMAIHTVGSCMAVRATAYAKAGGMNKRKAGEDFYFLHKLAPLGGWEYIPATVYPSARLSDRVPFGTGRAQLDRIREGQELKSYPTTIYQELKLLFETISAGYEHDFEDAKFSKAVQIFLRENHVLKQIREVRKQSGSSAAFFKRFWQWMDGFMVLKLIHFLRDHGFSSQPIDHVARELLAIHGITPARDLSALLQQFRELEFREK